MIEAIKTAPGSDRQVGTQTLRMRLAPRRYYALGIFAALAAVLWLDVVTGNNFPMGMFYLLVVYSSLRYVGRQFGYFIAVFAALAKVITATLTDDLSVPLFLWKFVSSASFYSIFCYLMDAQMTRGRRAEHALDELSALNDSIVSESDAGILVFRPGGECVLANQAAARLIGFDLKQLLQVHLNESELWQDSQLARIADEVSNSGLSYKTSFPLATYQGKEIWCQVSVSRIEHRAGRLLLVVLTDISAHKEVEHALRRAYREAEEARERAVLAEQKVVSVSEETQARIGQELHDDLGQHLTGVAFMSEMLFQQLKDKNLREMEDALKIKTLINKAIDKTRRVSKELFPVELDESSGLHAMLAQLADNVSSIFHVECTLEYGKAPITEHKAVINLFRIAQEAINNAIKHGAASQITLKVSTEGNEQLLEITDNGSGIDQIGPGKEGIGLRTMRYRASVMGGVLNIGAGRQGGASVIVRLPVTRRNKQNAAS